MCHVHGAISQRVSEIAGWNFQSRQTYTRPKCVWNIKSLDVHSTRFWNRGYERRRRRPRRPLEFKNGSKVRFLWAVSRRVMQISLRNFHGRCILWLSKGLPSLISVTWKCQSWETHDQRAFARNEESQEGREERRRLFLGLATQRVFCVSLRNFHVRRTW